MLDNNKDFILSRYGTVVDKLKRQEPLDDIELQIVNMTCDLFSKTTQENKPKENKVLTLQDKFKSQFKNKEITLQEKLKKQLKK